MKDWKVDDKMATCPRIPSGKVRAVLDTDTYNEVDDQFALAYALLAPEKIDLQAVYAAPFHNRRSNGPEQGMELSYEEIGRVFERLNRQNTVPVFKGSRKWLQDSDGPVQSAAAEHLIELARAPGDGPLYVMAIGAPTNVASAILMDPSIREKIVVIWLGGTPIYWESVWEFNLQQDLAASRVLLDSGVPLVRVPTTNVSEHLRVTLPELDFHLKGKNAICDYLNDICHSYKKPSDPPTWSKVIWDISAPAWLIDPDSVIGYPVHSPILTSEMTWSTRPDRHMILDIMKIRRDRIFADLFARLQQLD